MNKRQLMNKKQIILIISAIVVTPMLINILMLFTTPITTGDATSWIGFFGNYSGGIIGGIVAYWIAKYQLDRQLQREDSLKLSEEVDLAKFIIYDYLSDIVTLLHQFNEFIIKELKKSEQEGRYATLVPENTITYDENYYQALSKFQTHITKLQRYKLLRIITHIKALIELQGFLVKAKESENERFFFSNYFKIMFEKAYSLNQDDKKELEKDLNEVNEHTYLVRQEKVKEFLCLSQSIIKDISELQSEIDLPNVDEK